MFQKFSGWVVGAVISIVATSVAVQLGWIGTDVGFIQNLTTVAVIWVSSRVAAWIISRR